MTTRADIQIGTRFIRNARILPKEEPVPCPEDGCRGMLRRRYSQKLSSFYYMCDDPGCDGSVGCTPNGEIHGIPGDSKTKKARMEAHEVFDQLWKDGFYSRGKAYKAMAGKMGIDPLHIGDLNRKQCKALIVLVKEHLEELNAPETWDDDDGDDDGWFEVE